MFALWNEDFGLRPISFGCLTTQSSLNPYSSDRIPLGPAPWNLTSALKIPTAELFPALLDQTLRCQNESIPPGTGKYIEKLRTKLHQLSEWVELFCFNSLTVFDKTV